MECFPDGPWIFSALTIHFSGSIMDFFWIDHDIFSVSTFELFPDRPWIFSGLTMDFFWIDHGFSKSTVDFFCGSTM